MLNAPPVAFPVGRFVWGRVAHFLLAMCGATGLLIWQVQANVSSIQSWVSWFFWCVCVVAALWWAPRQTLSDGRMFWSGESWFCISPEGHQQGIEVSVCLDLNSALGLFVQPVDESGQPQGPAAYAWMRERTMPSKWHGFRCAVYSRPKVEIDLVRL